MRRHMLLGAVVALAAISAACPNECPDFKAVASTGETMTPATFTKVPTVIVFMTAGCPMNEKAVPMLNKLSASFDKKVRVVAFMDASAEAVKDQAKQLKAEFAVIPDPDKKVIKGFKAERSLCFSVIATKTEARWAKTWVGLSQGNLTEAIDLVVKHGREVPSVSLEQFPEKPVSGCAF